MNLRSCFLPVRCTKHLHKSCSNGSALTAGDTVKANVAPQFKFFNCCAHQTLWHIHRTRQKANADIGFEERQQVLV